MGFSGDLAGWGLNNQRDNLICGAFVGSLKLYSVKKKNKQE